MKVKALVSYHDTTYGKVYETTDPPSWVGSQEKSSVWVTDDVGDDYILFGVEYEVVNE